MEKNWGYTKSELADTADQDADKARTYDYARMEYVHLDTILFVGTSVIVLVDWTSANGSK